jgi:hypothetical protein
MPEYKKDYPNLKRSQYIDMIQKEFKKSPENPVYKQKLNEASNKNNKGEENFSD